MSIIRSPRPLAAYAVLVTVFLLAMSALAAIEYRRIVALEQQLGAAPAPAVAAADAGETRDEFIARNEAGSADAKRAARDLLYRLERSDGKSPEAAYGKAISSVR